MHARAKTSLSTPLLRDRAEQHAAAHAKTASALTDKQSLIYELQVHQVELEMQNEELGRAFSQTDAALARYTALYDFAPVSYISLTEHARVSHANLAAARLLGVSRRQLIDGNLGFFVVEENRAAFFAFLQKVRVQKGQVACLLDLMSCDKGIRRVQLTATMLVGVRDAEDSILLHIDDLTETERRKAELEDVLTEVDLSQRNASIGTGIYDLTSKTWSSSKTFDDLHGIDASFDRSLNSWLLLVHPEDRDAAMATFVDATESSKPFELAYRTANTVKGVQRRMIARGTVEVNLLTKAVRLVCTCQDVTDREQYKSAKEAAEKSSREKDAVLANVSHELRTPLTSILLRANLLQRGIMTEDKVRNCGALIEKAAKYQSLLIEDLIDLSRISTGVLRLASDPVSLPELIAFVVDSSSALAEQKGVQLSTLSEDNDLTVSGDRTRLQQVLLNLLNNAIKFTPSGGNVNVGLEAGKDWAKLSVEDDGKGVDAAFLPRLFERFSQDKSDTVGRHAGLGLGLNIAQEIVEAHRGTIEVQSEGRGCGAKFTIYLPLLSPQETHENHQPGENCP